MYTGFIIGGAVGALIGYLTGTVMCVTLAPFFEAVSWKVKETAVLWKRAGWLVPFWFGGSGTSWLSTLAFDELKRSEVFEGYVVCLLIFFLLPLAVPTFRFVLRIGRESN